MKQHPIDLLPPAIRERSQAGMRKGQAVFATSAALLLLVMLATHSSFERNKAEGLHEAARAEYQLVLEMENTANKLHEEWQKNKQYLRLYNRVAMPLDLSTVLASIVHELPSSVTLDRVDITAGAQRVNRGPRSRGTAQTDEPSPRVLVGELAGFAASDVDIAEVVEGLSKLKPLQNVSLDFSRTRDVRGHHAREFRLSFRIDLEQNYEVTLINDEDHDAMAAVEANGGVDVRP